MNYSVIRLFSYSVLCYTNRYETKHDDVDFSTRKEPYDKTGNL